MARIDKIKTHQLWGTDEECYVEWLKKTETLEVMINYYEVGITMMEAKNRDMFGTDHLYSEIPPCVLEMCKARDVTIEFYRERLHELKGK